MNYRKFKDVTVSEVGLGTWQLGSADWGNMNEEDALGLLQAYVEQGGNFIDTADVYGMGVSEQVIGTFIKSVTKDIYVATKLGRRHDAPNGWPQNFTYEAMKRHTEASLNNLGVDCLFLQQLHCIPSPEMQSGKVFDHLRRLQQDGLIRYFGASVETSEEALTCLDQEGLASLQIIFNLFRQHVADEVFAKAKEKNVALIVRVPLASGLLSGKFSTTTKFEQNDHRNYNANGGAFNAGETFSGVDFKEGVRFANEMKAMMPDDRLAQWAIRWVLDHPEVTTVIPGASKVSQVNNNVEASGLPSLPTKLHQSLREKYDHDIRKMIRGHY